MRLVNPRWLLVPGAGMPNQNKRSDGCFRTAKLIVRKGAAALAAIRDMIAGLTKKEVVPAMRHGGRVF